MSHIHIPDGVLPLWLWGAGWLLTLALVSGSGLLARRHDMRRKVPLLGVVAALMLVAMSSEIVPLAYHINLTVVAGIVLGPALSVIVAFIVQVILALLGHGGVTVVGLNAVITTIEMTLGWALFRVLVRVLSRKRAGLATGIATVLTLAATTTALVGIVWLGGSAATARETGALDPADLRFENPFASGVFSIGLLSGGHEGAGEAERDAESTDADGATTDAEADAHPAEPTLSVGRFAAVVYTLGPLGWLIEAFVSGSIVGYVARIRPSLVLSGALAEKRRRIPGDEAGGL